MMKMMLSAAGVVAVMALASPASAQCIGNCADNSENAEANASAAAAAASSASTRVDNNNTNLNLNSNTNRQGQLQGQEQTQGQYQGQNQSNLGIQSGFGSGNDTSVNIRSSADVDAEPAYAPDVSVGTTVPCLVGVGGSGGAGGVFSIGLSGGYIDEECETRELIRIGLDGGDSQTKALANKLLRAKLANRVAPEDRTASEQEAAESDPNYVAASTSSCGYDDPDDLVTYDWC